MRLRDIWKKSCESCAWGIGRKNLRSLEFYSNLSAEKTSPLALIENLRKVPNDKYTEYWLESYNRSKKPKFPQPDINRSALSDQIAAFAVSSICSAGITIAKPYFGPEQMKKAILSWVTAVTVSCQKPGSMTKHLFFSIQILFSYDTH